ncbi:MAG: succinylglutamate desuccinylase/aspartoacylase family protein [Rhodobacteraceae bacterium]|nr:succinylglutamate desuccinylase/aspartoacylase family protein [Paracoccaceae bacterium]
MKTERRRLAVAAPGTTREIACLRYGGGGTGPVVYLQAGLHADEMPGVLVLQHLLPLLDRAEAEGRLRGEVRVVPAANPIGLAQWTFQRPLGRQEAESLHNFNRGFPDLAVLAGERIEPRLGADPAANARAIRSAFREVVAEEIARARTEMIELQLALLSWSCDADVVLDLHCDHFAVLHLYASPERPEITSLLCRSIGAELALIEAVSGGNAFDEAHTAPWKQLRDRFAGRFPIPPPCFSATLEYRGQFDVDDATAGADAANLMTFLAALGALEGHGERPAHPDAPTLPLGGAAEVFAPHAGVVTWAAPPGATVREGDIIAHVTDPLDRQRTPVLAPVAGILFRQELWRPCLRGASLAHVAGDRIVRQGHLLSN